MESPSSEEPRSVKLFNFFLLQGKHPMLLSPEREIQPFESEQSRERMFLPQRLGSPLGLRSSFPSDTRKVDKSPTEEMETMREENRKLKEKVSLLHADNRDLRRRVNQTPNLLDNRSSQGQELDSPSSNVSTNNEDLASNYLQQCGAALMDLNFNQEKAPEMAMSKVRVSVKTWASVPGISDGCQWRKYGQKKAKGNPYPKSYYRCTMSSECSVRKQVQKLASDTSILSTTYEGQHNHPLPPAAKFMSSIIMSTKKMFLSGSMYNMNMLPRELATFFVPGMVYISESDRFPTVVLDMTKAAPFANPRLRNLQIVEVGQEATETQVNERITEAITYNPTFHAAIASVVTSFISGTPKP